MAQLIQTALNGPTMTIEELSDVGDTATSEFEGLGGGEQTTLAFVQSGKGVTHRLLHRLRILGAHHGFLARADNPFPDRPDYQPNRVPKKPNATVNKFCILSGRPFYAMRFIHGDSLKEAIARFHSDAALKKNAAERSARLRELLRRFTDVCNAVAYAHSRGVLHRDLKPGNIMLGPYGETLVVDWGLAKPLGETIENSGAPAVIAPDRSSTSLIDGPIRLSGLSGSRTDTIAGSPIGTPAFASPEQVLGRLDLLGPASDVYGLGATLYALLTGRAPADSRQMEEILRRVSKGDIPSPRSIDPAIPRPLEAICRKAMAVRPEDRYVSARALAEDVKRWMDDAPVTAYPEPILIRATRWVRRQQRLVAGAAAAVLVGTTALGIAFSRESSLNQALRKAKVESDRRLDQTLQAVEDYYTGVGAEVLLSQQEFQDLRARLLEKPRQFYEQLTKELASTRSPDDRTRSLLGKGRTGLGQIYRTLCQYDEALSQFEAATAFLHELASKENGAALQERLADNYINLGLTQIQCGNHLAAENSCREAIAIWSKLTAAQPDVPDRLRGLAKAYEALGVAQRTTGNLESSAVSFRQSITIYSKLTSVQPNATSYQIGLAYSYAGLGSTLAFSGDWSGAIKSHHQSIAIYVKLLNVQPNKLDYQEGLAGSYTLLTQAQELSKDQRGAVETRRKSIELWLRLTEARPNVSYYRYGLTASYNGLGESQRRAGQLTEALESYQQARSIAERLVHDQPTILDYKKTMAAILTNIGIIDMQQGRRLQGLRRFQEALTYWKEPFAKNPKDPFFSEGLKEAPKVLSDILGTKKSQEPARPPSTPSLPASKQP